MSTNQVGLAGEFAVLSQLSFRGFETSLTLGNAKSIDIFASRTDSNVIYKIEVKTVPKVKSSTKKNQFGPAYEWQMKEEHENIRDQSLFYCFVLIKKDSGGYLQYKFFIVPSNEVARYVKKQHKWWLAQNPNRNPRGRKFRLGTVDKHKYPVTTPLASRYENNWDILI